MPKSTFYNLPKQKQDLVLQVCKKEFEQHALATARVSNIVHKLNIARGSFYQYFEDLEDCYFTVLKQETVETHELFVKALAEEAYELFPALESYGRALANELFLADTYAMYRNRFLFWTPELESRWRQFQSQHLGHDIERRERVEFRQLVVRSLNIKNKNELEEIMLYIQAVVHALIHRLFVEQWDAATFMQHYHLHVTWLANGLRTVDGDRASEKR